MEQKQSMHDWYKINRWSYLLVQLLQGKQPRGGSLGQRWDELRWCKPWFRCNWQRATVTRLLPVELWFYLGLASPPPSWQFMTTESLPLDANQIWIELANPSRASSISALHRSDERIIRESERKISAHSQRIQTWSAVLPHPRLRF